MNYQKGLLALTALGLAAAMVAPTGAYATAKKTTKKPAAKPTTKPTAAPAAAATTAPPSAAPAAKTGGKLIFGMEAETNNWIPGPGSWAVSGQQVSFAVYERLLALNAKSQIVPWLADSVTKDTSGLVWTIKIKKGIKFHNGEDFDANAVKANLDEAICGSVLLPVFFRINGAGALCSKEPLPKLLRGVTVVDPQTVQVTTLQKFPGFQAAMSGQGLVASCSLRSTTRNSRPRRRRRSRP